MSFFDFIKEIMKKYSKVVQELIYDFLYSSEHEEKDINYYRKLLERIEEDIKNLKKEIREKENLKKEIERKINERIKEEYKYSQYQYEYGSNKKESGYFNNYNETDKNIRKYYAMLELNYGAGIDDVKRAYRNLMKKYHPDFFSNDPEKQKIAKEVAQGLTRAYEELIKYLNKK